MKRKAKMGDGVTKGGLNSKSQMAGKKRRERCLIIFHGGKVWPRGGQKKKKKIAKEKTSFNNLTKG